MKKLFYPIFLILLTSCTKYSYVSIPGEFKLKKNRMYFVPTGKAEPFYGGKGFRIQRVKI